MTQDPGHPYVTVPTATKALAYELLGHARQLNLIGSGLYATRATIDRAKGAIPAMWALLDQLEGVV